jgi:membrane fusion protein, multidrug efflux system
MKIVSLAIISALSLSLVACGESTPPPAAEVQAPAPAEVDVSLPLKHQLTDWDEFTGRFEAINAVDIRARVTGYLIEKKFKDGQLVKKGDVLFVIDPRPFEYVLQRAKAEYSLAKSEYERANKLRDMRAVSVEELERRSQEVLVAKSAMDDAELQKAFTQVRSPIDGKISDSFVDVGNLVDENSTMLTRIVSINPIHFRFEGSQGQLLKYLRLARAGERPSSDTAPNAIYIKLLDEDKYYHAGKMDFVDNIVDGGTGTIQARAIVENNDGLIYPGLFGNARLIGRSNYQAILLPEGSINTDQSKKFVYIVDKDNKVKRAYVSIGTILDNGLVVVSKGLTGDERVVINGIQRIRSAAQEVTPNSTTIEWKDIDTLVKSDQVETNPPSTDQQ